MDPENFTDIISQRAIVVGQLALIYEQLTTARGADMVSDMVEKILSSINIPAKPQPQLVGFPGGKPDAS